MSYEQRTAGHARWHRLCRVCARIVAVNLIFVAIGFISLALLLHNQGFRQRLLQIAHQRILDATGLDLRLRDFSVHLAGLSPTVDMYDVVVDGATPYNSEPLLRVDRLSVGVTVVSLLHQNWYLNDVTINHPVVRLIVDQNGATNLPQPKQANSSSNTDIFDLGVRHVQLDRGELYYNDNKNELQADVRDFQIHTGFDALLKRYSGGLAYHDGMIKYQEYDALRHSLNVEFDADRDTFHVKSGTLTAGKSKLDVNATLQNYSTPAVQATYHVSLDGGELRDLLKNDALPAGSVQLAGTAQFHQDANKPPLETVSVEGNLSSPALLVETSGRPVQVQDISGRYSLHNGALDVSDVSAGVLGGNVKGSLEIRDLSGAADSRLQAVVHNISLRTVQTLANPSSLQQIEVAGTTSATVEAHWRKSLDAISARADATIHGTIAPPRNGGNGSVPLNGEIHAGYNAATKEITFSRSLIRMLETSLTLNGTLSNRSALRVQFESKDVHEVEMAAAVFSPTVSQQQLALAGTASLSATVTGTTDAPKIQGQFAGAELHIKGTEWRSAQAAFALDPSHLSLTNGDLNPGRGHIGFSFSAGLNRWSFDKGNPIQIDLNAAQLDVAQLKTLASIETPVTGTLRANVSLHGSIENPVGRGSIHATEVTLSSEPIQSLDINFQGNGERVDADIAVSASAGSARGALTYFPEGEEYQANFVAKDIRLDQLGTLRAQNMQIHGSLNIEASGNGTLANPRIVLKTQIPELQFQNQTIKDLTLQAAVDNHAAKIDLDSQAMHTFVRGHGVVNLTGDYDADATFDTSTISLQPIIAAYLPAQAQNVTGETEIHGIVKGPLKDTTRLQAHVSIPTFGVRYKNNVQLSASSPLKFDYASGVLTIQRSTIEGTGTNLQLQGTIPITTSGPASLLLAGTIDLQIAQLFDPDITSSGQIRLDINSYGRADAAVQGRIQLVNANFTSADFPTGFSNGNGVLNLTPNRLQIESLSGSIGGGPVNFTGGVTYKPSLQYALNVSGRNIRFHIPDGVREGLDTDLTLTGTADSGNIRGQIRLNDVSFARDFDFSTIAGSVSSANPGVPSPFLQGLHLNVNVQSTNGLNLVSSALSLQGAANLRVQGTAANPVLLGRINVTGGDLIFRGTRYQLQPSTVAFVNPYQIEPRLDVNVDTTADQYKVHMQFRGTLDHLRTTYTSEPPLPQADVINLLVFGKTTEQQAANPTPGNIAAESMIASTVSSQVTGRIQKGAGISQLSVDPVLKDNVQNPGARVTIQQRVTGSLFVTFATDVTGTQRETVKVEYQATPRLSVLGVRDENGGFALDFRIRKTW